VSLPVLFTLLFCFMELCLAFYSYDTISESAREGTRHAIAAEFDPATNSSGATCTATAAQVNSYVSGLAGRIWQAAR